MIFLRQWGHSYSRSRLPFAFIENTPCCGHLQTFRRRAFKYLRNVGPPRPPWSSSGSFATMSCDQIGCGLSCHKSRLKFFELTLSVNSCSSEVDSAPLRLHGALRFRFIYFFIQLSNWQYLGDYIILKWLITNWKKNSCTSPYDTFPDKTLRLCVRMF